MFLGIDLRQCSVHIYSFEFGEEGHINLGLTFNVVCNAPIVSEDNLHFHCIPKCAA